jgi:hypothetical protein
MTMHFVHLNCDHVLHVEAQLSAGGRYGPVWLDCPVCGRVRIAVAAPTADQLRNAPLGAVLDYDTGRPCQHLGATDVRVRIGSITRKGDLPQ